MESEYDFTAYSGDQFVKGLNHLNGAQAEQEVKKATDWNVVIYSVNGSDAYNSWGAYVMEPDMETVEHAKELMQRVLDGEVLDQEVDAPNPYGEN